MPGPQIPEQNITFLSNRLNRRPHLPPLLHDVGQDIALWFSDPEFGVRELRGRRREHLVSTSSGLMRAEPEFGGARGWVEGTEGDVRYYVEGALRYREQKLLRSHGVGSTWG
jgi:hypothetical protein